MRSLSSADRPNPLLLAAAMLCGALALTGYSYLFARIGVERWETWEAIGFAAALVAMLHLMLRSNVAAGWFMVPPLLILLPQLNPRWATYWHGFMHTSIVYQILDHGTPPENPLMAGEPLRYMYGHHAVIAWLMRWVPISPPQAFFLSDILSLSLFMMFIDRTARLISSDRVFRVFVGFLALCAPSPFLRGPLAALVEHDWFGKRLVWHAEQRFIPLMKFVGINNNQLGLMFFAMALFGLVSIGAGKERSWTAYFWVATAVLCAGIVYPPCWLSIVACSCAAALCLFLQGERNLRIAAGILIGIVALCSAAVLPSMLGVTAGKNGASSAVNVLSSYSHLRQNGAELVLLLVLPAILIWCYRKSLIAEFRRLPLVGAMLLSFTAIGLGVYLLAALPGRIEYKFVHMSVFALSFPTAMALHNLYRARAAVALAVMFLVAVPVAVDLVHQPPADTVADLVRSDGVNLRHTDPAEAALYSWIARQTPTNAIFIDTHLTIPVLAHRSLLIGLDARRDAGELKGFAHDGWLITAEEFLTQTTGVDLQRYAVLKQVVGNLLTADAAAFDPQQWRKLEQYRLGRPLYVVARSEELRARFAGISQLVRVYQGEGASVFEFRFDL